MLEAELLIDAPMIERGHLMLAALAACRPPGVIVSKSYRGSKRLLVVYGVGRPDRFEIRRRHLAAGGRVAMWDLGYWNRHESLRLSVDSLHPTAAQLAMAPDDSRPHPKVLREDANPAGPVVLVGVGRKTSVMLGVAPMAWEAARLAEINTRFPGRKVLWRPKGSKFDLLPGAALRHGMPIEDVLRGASLVVCRHSNVAIDACIAGVPAECEDGAARAVFTDGMPSRAARLQFLGRLGWWNWAPAEARGAWKWMREVTRR